MAARPLRDGSGRRHLRALVGSAVAGAHRHAVGRRCLLHPRDVACRGERLQAPQRARRHRRGALPASVAGDRRRPPVAARQQRSNDSRTLAASHVLSSVRRLRADRVQIPQNMVAGRVRRARDDAVVVLHARLVLVGRAVSRDLVRDRDADLSVISQPGGEPRARRAGLGGGRGELCPAHRRGRRVRGLGGRQSPATAFPAGGAACRVVTPPCGVVADVCRLGRAQPGVHSSGLRISAGAVQLLQRQLREEHRAARSVRTGEGPRYCSSDG